MQIIDHKKFLSESEKAIQIVLENEDKFRRQVPTANRLRIVQEELKKAKSREEFEELTQLKKDLELKVRLNELHYPAIPPEHREKIQLNRELEDQTIVEKINELKKELAAAIAKIEDELIPLVTNIANLEDRRLIAKQIDILLDGEIYESPYHPSPTYFMKRLSFSADGRNSMRAKKLLSETVESLKRIQVPIESKGFFKRNKKVGAR